MVPNIFNYATKELSQDALICWLVACAKEETNERLRECGRKFVQALMKCGDGAVIDVSNDPQYPVRHAGSYDVGGILDGPEPQYRKIDVYFQAEVDGKRVSFVIEDKKDGEMHGDQLKRYLEIVQRDKREEDLIKPVYFKTGYVFDDEREKAKSNGFSVFENKDMLAFLSSGNRAGAHEILRQFREHLDGMEEDRSGALRNLGHSAWFRTVGVYGCLGESAADGRKNEVASSGNQHWWKRVDAVPTLGRSRGAFLAVGLVETAALDAWD